MTYQNYQAEYTIEGQDVRGQACLLLGRREEKWNFQAPNFETAFQMARDHKRDLRLKNPAYDSVSFSVKPFEVTSSSLDSSVESARQEMRN